MIALTNPIDFLKPTLELARLLCERPRAWSFHR